MRIFYFIALTLSLSACEWQVKPQHGRPAALLCENPQLARAYQQNISEALNQILELRIKSEYPDLLETEKIIRAFDQSRVLLSSAKGNQQEKEKQRISCQAQLNISISPPVFDSARTYSPFIYTPNSYLREINSVASANLVSLNNNTLIQEINYRIDTQNPNLLAEIDNQEVTRMAQVITTILLPYGVNNTVTLNGVVMDRNDALARILYTAAEEKKSTQALEIDTNTENKPTISQEESTQINSKYQAAQTHLRQIWQKLDETVRQSLADEQHNWSEGLTLRCETDISNPSLPSNEAQKVCKTRQIEERIGYLRGFMIE